VPVLLILASVVILVGVVAVAIGRGGEMAEFAGDYPPFDTDDLLTAADVALLRPPSALWGYNAAATDQALGRVAQVVTERDVEIAALRKQLAELRAATGYTTGSFGAIGSPGSTGSFGAIRSSGAAGSSGAIRSSGAAGSSGATGSSGAAAFGSSARRSAPRPAPRSAPPSAPPPSPAPASPPADPPTADGGTGPGA
jgi:hypothetical protein